MIKTVKMRFLNIIYLILLALALIILVKNPNITSSAVEIPEYTCGDGKCTIPLEDQVTCPEDCFKEEKDYSSYFIIGLAVIFLGIFYFNFYRGKIDFRSITRGKNPFKKHDDYKRVYNYIDSALKIHMDKKKIINNLYHKGWNKKQILYASEDVRWNQRKVLLETAPKVTPNLNPAEDYILRCRAVNIDDKKIKKALLDKGWKISYIDKAFHNAIS